jgi:RHS repeat-associated protein
MTRLNYGPGKVLSQTFDLDYRLTDKSVTGLDTLSYSYDLINNITSIDYSLDSTKNQSLTYDKLSRLLNAEGSYGTLGFTYDLVGNRMSKTEAGSTDVYNYTSANSDLVSVSGANPIALTYDAIGNTLTKNDLTFTYNQQGRLKSATKENMNASYVYSFKGERTVKQVNGVSTHFIYDLQGQLIAEADSNGVIQNEYIYLNGQRLASISKNTFYYVHTDHLGTPIALTDDAGTVRWKASYTPFGKATVEVNTVENNIRFPGQYFDAETGLHYNYFRDYDPEIGRYIQSDPIGLAGGINT